MGLKTFRCLHCRREVSFSAPELVAHFKRRGMTTWLPWAGRYFVCRGRGAVTGCGHRGATFRPKASALFFPGAEIRQRSKLGLRFSGRGVR